MKNNISQSVNKDECRRLNQLMAFIFVVGINLSLLGAILKIDPVRSYGRLAVAPQIPSNIKQLAQTPGNFKAYYTDNFGFRGFFINLHGKLMFNFFQVSPSHKVQIGKNGWLFLKSEKTMDDWRNLDPFNEKELDGWQKMLETRHKFSAKLGIPYIFVIAPNKHTIYGAKQLPPHLQPINNISRLDQLISRLKSTNSPVRIVDLRETLHNASKNYRTYHRTDTHWNDLGAYMAYTKIAEELKGIGISVHGSSPSQIEIKRETTLGGDLARMIGLKGNLTEELILVKSSSKCKLTHENGSSLIVEELDTPGNKAAIILCPEAKNLKAVVFHDSFGKSLYPYIAREFQRTRFVSSNNFDPNIVKQEKPNIVIQQLVERRLFNHQPNLNEFQN